MGKKKQIDFTYDDLEKDVESALIDIGYQGALPIRCKGAAEWIESNYPKAVWQNGIYLWKEDLEAKARKKYPQKLVQHFDINHFKRRNEIIRLGIEEIKNNKGKNKGNKIVRDRRKNIEAEIEDRVKTYLDPAVRGGFREGAIADRKLVINRLQQILDGVYYMEDISYSAKIEALIGELKESIQ